MFETSAALMAPLQFGLDSTAWRGVELILHEPWLIATFVDGEGLRRTILLSGPDDLLQGVPGSHLGSLTNVQLVLPPGHSPSNEWALVPMCRVERTLESAGRRKHRVVLVSRDGQRYSGDPVVPTDQTESEVTLLVELPSTNAPHRS